MTDLTAEKLHALLRYDAETGVFVWLETRGKAIAGQVAGRVGKNGYLSIGIDGTKYLAHRLAWLYTHGRWPVGHLDHRDGCRAANQIDNLREATRSQNNSNTPKYKNNTSGFKGVFWRPDTGRWSAMVSFNRKRHCLGCFDSAEEARGVYLLAAARLHGEFARAA
jgi:hypothetical protein